MYNISPVSLQINERFFEAISILKRKRTIKGLSDFAKRYGFQIGNFYTIRAKKSGAIKAEYLYYLSKDFGISPQWLLTGEGEMFTRTSSKNEESPNQETSSSKVSL